MYFTSISLYCNHYNYSVDVIIIIFHFMIVCIWLDSTLKQNVKIWFMEEGFKKKIYEHLEWRQKI